LETEETELYKKLQVNEKLDYYRPDGTNYKTSASGARGMGFKSQADQISHTLPKTCHRCNLNV